MAAFGHMSQQFALYIPFLHKGGGLRYRHKTVEADGVIGTLATSILHSYIFRMPNGLSKPIGG